jgi:hypothetical protein
MDCTNGCDGGNPITVFSTILDKPAVESWSDTMENGGRRGGGGEGADVEIQLEVERQSINRSEPTHSVRSYFQ